MNGQMFQIASIVAASKKALQLSEPIRFSPLEYENKIEFVFLPQKKFFANCNNKLSIFRVRGSSI